MAVTIDQLRARWTCHEYTPARHPGPRGTRAITWEEMKMHKEIESYEEAASQTGDGGVACAILVLAEAVNSLAYQVRYLGNGSADTPMGAIEAHGKFVSEALEGVASSMGEISRAIEGDTP
jgi:hypothetical protein